MKKKILLLLFCFCGLSTAQTNTTTTNVNASTTTTTASTISKGAVITKPGCPRQCGNLTVPYPFGIGIGTGCAFGEWYQINCNTSFNPPRPFIGEIRVYEITDSQVRVANVVAKKCYNQTGQLIHENPSWTNLGGTPYTFTEANKFTVIGYDDLAVLSGSEGRNFTSGCVSLLLSSVLKECLVSHL